MCDHFNNCHSLNGPQTRGNPSKNQSTKKVHNHSLTSKKKTANKKKPKESLCNLSLEKTLEKKAYSELWGFFTLKK